MKKALVFWLLLLFVPGAGAQPKKEEAQLRQRLEELMECTRQLDFERCLALTHPRIFTLTSRDSLLRVMQVAFDNEALRMSIDSAYVTDISPPFQYGKATYRRIGYHLGMRLQFKDSAVVEDQDFIQNILPVLKDSFQGTDVRFERETGSFLIKNQSVVIGIKDQQGAPWLFLGYQRGKPFVEKLFPAAVRKHFRLE
jgi:hypothetical protein